jgi:hypothetical protein
LNYDCHFADYTDEPLRKTIQAAWRPTLTDALKGLLTEAKRTSPITRLYDLLSEDLYQRSVGWQDIRGVQVYHRMFKDVAGPDVLVGLAEVVATNISLFCDGPNSFRHGWHRLQGDGETLEIGFEKVVGDDRLAIREGDVEPIRARLVKERPWLDQLPERVRDALVLAELVWGKVKELHRYEWGGVAVSFIKPVEHCLKIRLGLTRRETLGEIVGIIRTAQAWKSVQPQISELNGYFIRAKHLEPPPLNRPDVERTRMVVYDVLRFASQRE